jgi:hypothetical protein
VRDAARERNEPILATVIGFASDVERDFAVKGANRKRIGRGRRWWRRRGS